MNTSITFEMKQEIANIAALHFHNNMSLCVELAVGLWLNQFSEVERTMGIRGLFQKVYGYPECECDGSETEEATAADWEKQLEDMGYKWFMSLGEVIAVTGMTAKDVKETIESVEINDAGDIRYRRREVAAFVDPDRLFQS